MIPIFSIIFILIYACNLICDILRYDPAVRNFINIAELIIPTAGIITSSLLLLEMNNITLCITSYSLNYLIFPGVIPFVLSKKEAL